MPELPEVETICRSLGTKIVGQTMVAARIKNAKLRQPIPRKLVKILPGQQLHRITRCGKYILLHVDLGTLIIHLGMSGNLQIKPSNHEIGKHEHFNVTFDDGLALCYSDPRRFGAILWTEKPPSQHGVLKNLGCEPLSQEFTAEFLWQRARAKRCSIKQLLMDNKIVTGIGNIYANEILFATQIYPLRSAASITKEECRNIVKESRKILRLAIRHGGTTLKDYTDGKGKRGSFQRYLKVYGRAGKECTNCQTKLAMVRIGQRSTVFCPRCQRQEAAG